MIVNETIVSDASEASDESTDLDSIDIDSILADLEENENVEAEVHAEEDGRSPDSVMQLFDDRKLFSMHFVVPHVANVQLIRNLNYNKQVKIITISGTNQKAIFRIFLKYIQENKYCEKITLIMNEVNLGDDIYLFPINKLRRIEQAIRGNTILKEVKIENTTGVNILNLTNAHIRICLNIFKYSLLDETFLSNFRYDHYTKCDCPNQDHKYWIEYKLKYIYDHCINSPSRYMKPIKQSTSEKECCICYETLKCTSAHQCLQCDNMYHTPCITEWMNHSFNACPMCRTRVRPFVQRKH